MTRPRKRTRWLRKLDPEHFHQVQRIPCKHSTRINYVGYPWWTGVDRRVVFMNPTLVWLINHDCHCHLFGEWITWFCVTVCWVWISMILELVKDPNCSAAFGLIQNLLDRLTLDSKKSHSAPGRGGEHSMADQSNGWLRLLKVFNDPAVHCENVTVVYTKDGKKRNPWAARTDRLHANMWLVW